MKGCAIPESVVSGRWQIAEMSERGRLLARAFLRFWSLGGHQLQLGHQLETHKLSNATRRSGVDVRTKEPMQGSRACYHLEV